MDYTSRLRLRKPDGSDPFLRDDFLVNFDLLDANPGFFICTSTTRPTGWTGADLGRMIYETDTRRVMAWNNPGWVDIESAPHARTGSMNPSQNLGRNAKATYTVISDMNVRRSGKVIVIGICRLGIDGGRTQKVWVDPWVNGSNAAVGAGGYWRHQDNGTGASGEDSVPIPVLGVRNVDPGNLNIQTHVEVGDHTASVTTGTIQMMAFLAS